VEYELTDECQLALFDPSTNPSLGPLHRLLAEEGRDGGAAAEGDANPAGDVPQKALIIPEEEPLSVSEVAGITGSR
jgi:hypothetical protein